MTELNNQQLIRYNRQIVLPDFGQSGQQKLLKAKVLIIGAGGLGSPCALYLGCAGIGTIGLADPDTVSLENLQRQILHSEETLNKPKVESAHSAINSLNPDIKVIPYNLYLDSDNIADIIKDYEVVVDCSDNFPTRYLLNDACLAGQKVFCHAGVLRYDGQVMTILPGKSACYRCLFPEEPETNLMPAPAEAGILGAVAGVIGSIQATEVIKYILGLGDLLTNRLLIYNALGMDFRCVPVPRNPQCRSCG